MAQAVIKTWIIVFQKVTATNMAGKSIGTIDGSGVSKFLPSQAGGTGTGSSQVENVFTTILGFLTIVAGLSFLIYFLLGGMNWILAGGNEKKVEEAKSYMTNGAIGLIIVIGAYAIISIVGTVLGLNILSPATMLEKLGK